MKFEPTPSHYAVLGEFLVEFQTVCRTMTFFYNCLMQRHGLRKPILADILLNNKAFTADPINESLRSAIFALYADNENLKIEFDRIYREFRILIETRNEIAHGILFNARLGQELEETDEIAARSIGSTLRIRKHGLRRKDLPTVSELQRMVDQAKVLSADLRQLFVANMRPFNYVHPYYSE